jgi:hypothetical protein
MTAEHHENQPGLFDGINATTVGGPFVQVPPAFAIAVGLAGQGRPVSLFKFNPEIGHKSVSHHGHEQVNSLKLGKEPQILTASIAMEGANGSVQPPTGPLVGIVRYGVGNGAQQVVEFDIQMGFPLFTVPAPIGQVQPSGGAMLTVPCTSLELLARNDANMILFGGTVPLGLQNSTPPQVTGSLARGQRTSTAQLTRTLYGVYQPGGAPVAAGTIIIPVAARAVSFRIFRVTVGAITVNILDQCNNFVDGFVVAATDPCPEILLPGWCSNLAVVTTGNTTVMGAIYRLAL